MAIKRKASKEVIGGELLTFKGIFTVIEGVRYTKKELRDLIKNELTLFPPEDGW